MQLNNLKFLSLSLAPRAPCSMNRVIKAVVQTTDCTCAFLYACQKV